MTLRRFIAQVVFDRLAPITVRRAPDLVIGEPDRPYMLRWWLIPKNPIFGIYLHNIRRSDDDRALHDHPYVNASFLLAGAYIEHTIAAGGIHHRKRRVAGDLTFRTARAAHRLEIAEEPCWSLFFTGPRIRMWGFCCPNGWVDHETFAETIDGVSTISRGCGEP